MTARKEVSAPSAGGIYQTLLDLGLVREETVSVFSRNTRDVRNLEVLRDSVSGVIFIDGHYVGDAQYRSGAYRGRAVLAEKPANIDYEDKADTQRRFSAFLPHIVGKRIGDFGCGAGSFLKRARLQAREVIGVELQDDWGARLNKEGIPCVNDLTAVDGEVDTFFLFHCLEHLPDPIRVLMEIREKLVADGNGRIVIEVPHARDFLISTLALPEFIEFTLWSQHLILHTRESLGAFLREAGYNNIVISGVQRFGLANHLHWLNVRRPGGHKSSLAMIEDESLVSAYTNALARIDANDTLIAIATT